MSTNKYEKSKIYQIIDMNTEEKYIGSTTQTLARRLAGHVADYKYWENGTSKKYVSSFNIIKENNYRIELLEAYKCDTLDQLRAKEGEYIRKLNCKNKQIAGRSRKEYTEDHKEVIKQYAKDNEDQLKEYRKNYYKERNNYIS